MKSSVSTDINPNSVMDVAIVGGGVAGAYCAYRLMSKAAEESRKKRGGREKLDVQLFEISDRIGGRLWSRRFPEVPTYPAELGGMAFNDMMQNVFGLCAKELDLPMRSFVTYDNVYLQYLRSHRFPNEAYTPEGEIPPDYYPNVIPYWLKESERGKTPGTIIMDMINRALPPELRVLLAAYQKEAAAGNVREALNAYSLFEDSLRLARISCEAEASVCNEPFYETGFWDLMNQSLGIEAYYLVYQAGGLNTMTKNWNCYDAVLYYTSFGSRPFKQLTDGYQTLPVTLVEKFRENGGTVHLGERLYYVGRVNGETGPIKQPIGTVPDDGSGDDLLELVFGPPVSSVRTRVFARNVILAMPQFALKQLDSESIIFRSVHSALSLNTVTSHASSKFFLTYDRPWWKEIEYAPGKYIVDGRSVTDLPMRQCLYVGNEPDDGPALLMGSYDDGPFAGYWDGYNYGSQWGPVMPNEFQGVVPTRPMLKDISRQLCAVHGRELPRSRAAIFHDWSQAPFGGAWHFWNPRVRSWVTIPGIRRPIGGVNLYTCGESFSNQQGWVEGAINTAEMVLEEYFGMPRPDWVDSNYRFGP